MRKPTASAITSGGSAMCESSNRIMQTGNFATGYTKFSKRFITRLQDDWVAETRLKQKRCEDSPHSDSEGLRETALRAKFFTKRNCFRAPFGVHTACPPCAGVLASLL